MNHWFNSMQSERSTPGDAEIHRLLAETPYRALSLLGRGAMGEVWLVEHEWMGREFALKVLHRRHLSNPGYAERLRLEARAMAALEHPNIAEVTDFWVAADGRPCLVMERLCGQRLDRELLTRGRLPGPEVVAIGRQLLSGLIAAHEIGLVHRDLRPENLFLHQTPHQARVLKILDFGLARVVVGPTSCGPLRPLDLTRTGTVVGTPRFLAPEVLVGERTGPEGDVYSAGVVLYLCLVGLHSNFDFSTLPVFHPPSQVGAVQCSAQLDDVVLRAVEVEREHRYRSAREFLADLDSCDPSASTKGVTP